LQTLYALSDSAFNKAQLYIIDNYRGNLTPAENPVAVIIGAQPGAGKSELETIAQTELGGNVMVCNLDALRDFHPDAETIKRKHEAYYPDITGDYAWKWRAGLLDYCVENRLNFIMEVTFADGVYINSVISGLRENDYQVNLKLLAVHPQLSLIGIQDRYEQQKLENEAGRMVVKEAHDDRYSKLIPTLITVQAESLYSKMEIYGRNVASGLHSDVHGVHLIAINPPNAVQVFQQVFDQLWPDKLVQFFEEKMQSVVQLKEARNAPQWEIAKFKEEMQTQYISPRQLQQLAEQRTQELKAAQQLKAAQEQQDLEQQRKAEEQRQNVFIRKGLGKDRSMGGPSR
jgi:predicted ABC-type ATPase